MAGVLFLQPKIYRLSMSFAFIEFIVCLPALYVNIGLVFCIHIWQKAAVFIHFLPILLLIKDK